MMPRPGQANDPQFLAALEKWNQMNRGITSRPRVNRATGTPPPKVPTPLEDTRRAQAGWNQPVGPQKLGGAHRPPTPEEDLSGRPGRAVYRRGTSYLDMTDEERQRADFFSNLRKQGSLSQKEFEFFGYSDRPTFAGPSAQIRRPEPPYRPPIPPEQYSDPFGDPLGDKPKRFLPAEQMGAGRAQNGLSRFDPLNNGGYLPQIGSGRDPREFGQSPPPDPSRYDQVNPRPKLILPMAPPAERLLKRFR